MALMDQSVHNHLYHLWENQQQKVSCIKKMMIVLLLVTILYHLLLMIMMILRKSAPYMSRVNFSTRELKAESYHLRSKAEVL